MGKLSAKGTVTPVLADAVALIDDVGGADNVRLATFTAVRTLLEANFTENLVGGLVEITSIDGAADYFLVRDATDSSLKKVLGDNLPGGGGSPGGADTQVQYNSSGSFAGDAGLVYADGTGTLTATILTVGGITNPGTWHKIYNPIGQHIAFRSNNSDVASFNGQAKALTLLSNISLSWKDGTAFTDSTDLTLFRDAADTLALRRGENSQTYRLYARHGSETDHQRMAIATTKATASAVSGASVTLSNLIPAGAHVLGVTSKVETALGTGNGTTAYQVGDGSTANRFGDSGAVALGTVTQNSDWTTDTTTPFFAAANDIVLTAVTGNFDGTGAIEVSVQYIRGEAD